MLAFRFLKLLPCFIVLFSTVQCKANVCEPLETKILRKNSKPKELFLEAKASYYVSTRERFRDIYGNTGLYRIETNIQLHKDLFTWINLGYLYTSGKTNLKSKTQLHLVPLGFGISFYARPGKRFRHYVGVGPLVAYSHIHNESKFVTGNQDGWGGGFLAKAGVIANLRDNFFLDFFVDYSYIRLFYHNGNKELSYHREEVSGVSTGGGLGYQF